MLLERPAKPSALSYCSQAGTHMRSMPPMKHTKKWRIQVHQFTPSCTLYMTKDQSAQEGAGTADRLGLCFQSYELVHLCRGPLQADTQKWQSRSMTSNVHQQGSKSRALLYSVLKSGPPGREQESASEVQIGYEMDHNPKKAGCKASQRQTIFAEARWVGYRLGHCRTFCNSIKRVESVGGVPVPDVLQQHKSGLKEQVGYPWDHCRTFCNSTERVESAGGMPAGSVPDHAAKHNGVRGKQMGSKSGCRQNALQKHTCHHDCHNTPLGDT
eukprot:1156954-Pelagomonas_calceolata.AAC.7